MRVDSISVSGGVGLNPMAGLLPDIDIDIDIDTDTDIDIDHALIGQSCTDL